MCANRLTLPWRIRYPGRCPGFPRGFPDIERPPPGWESGCFSRAGKFVSSSLSPARKHRGTPRGIHHGLFRPLECGNHLHSFLSLPGVERAGPAKKTQGPKAGRRRAGAGGRGGGAGLWRPRGFPTTASGSGRRDPAKAGSLREENGTRQPRSLSCLRKRHSTFPSGSPPLRGIPQTPPYTLPRRRSLLGVPRSGLPEPPPAARRPA